MANHLSSYDHHHKKVCPMVGFVLISSDCNDSALQRFKEMKEDEKKRKNVAEGLSQGLPIHDNYIEM